MAYKNGAYNAICQVCGFQYKNYQLKERWDGLIVCRKDYETRHPTELFNPNLDEAVPPWTRPEGEDTLIAGPACTIEGRSAYPDLAVAECTIAGFFPTLT